MSVSKKGFLTTIKWVLIGVVFCITIISIFIMVYASQYDESYHSSYGLEDEFKTLQFYSNTRTALLKIGFSDTGLIVPWVEGQQQKIYEDGIKKITTLINQEKRKEIMTKKFNLLHNKSSKKNQFKRLNRKKSKNL